MKIDNLKKKAEKKIIFAAAIVISIILLPVLFFLIYGKNEQKELQAEYEILRDKNITFLTSQSKYYDEYDLMAAVVEELYKCKVEFQVIPDSEYASFLKLKLATKEVPDVFEYNTPAWNMQIGAADHCLDLSEEPWTERLVDSESIRDLTDGNIYAMPRESSSGYTAVYYNKKVLAECGIEGPAPQTYQDFMDMLEEIKSHNKEVIPFYAANAEGWTTQAFLSAGYAVSLGDSADLLTLYKSLLESEYVNDDQTAARYDSAADMLGSGRAAMFLTTEATAFEVAAKYPGCELGAFVMPYADNKTLPVSQSVSGLFIPEDGEQTEEARAFLNVWSLPEVQNVFFFRNGGFSAFDDTAGGKVLDCLQQLKDDYLDHGDYVYQMSGQTPDYIEIFNEFDRK